MSVPTSLERITTLVRDIIRSTSSRRPTRSKPGSATPPPTRGGASGRARRGKGSGSTTPGAAYPGDATALPDLTYAPQPDGRPDPGEVVWTWVPYEEDHTTGKDRPVLVIGREGDWLIALALTSKDHDRDEDQERESGREWVDIGAGSWDRRGRPSEVRVNRLIRVDPNAVRREGAVLSRARYDAVVAAAQAHHRS